MSISLHPQAKFDPIPPDLDLDALVESAPNFEWVLRISAAQVRTLGQQRFEQVVLLHVINGGKPLVIEGWNDRLPSNLFSARWLEHHYDKKQENVWDIGSQTNIPMTTGHYLRSMKQLTDQWTPTNFRDERRQRLYLKDIDCPVEWHERLQKILPRSVFYLNENVEGRGNANDDDLFIEEQPVARAGDLMSSLPEEMRAQNLMCYIGHEGTYTPAHREMCASLGQNIMVDASGSENGEKPGSSIWFMTETKDREVVREYFLSMLGHDVEIEKHFAQINAWKKATFPVYVVEQRVGDFILVPPLAPHQVWNRGTRTMKVAWNRTTVETLEMALHEALPKARLVCRDEQYKNKAIIYYTLKKYYNELSKAQTSSLTSFGFGNDLPRNSARTDQVAEDFKKLLQLYTEILVDEMFSSKEKDVEYIEFDSNITCSYCRANIFNRFLTCKHCIRELVNGDEDTYDICMECYAMGRSCVCVSGLTWCEQWRWSELTDNYELWRSMVIANDGYIDIQTSPLPLEVARSRAGKKSIAQICQEQLRRRPFKDITKPDDKPELEEPEEPEVDDNGNIIKRKGKRKKKKGEVYRCHVCQRKDNTYRLAFCSTPGCTEAYCFGVLYRGFDMMPQAVFQQEKWKCPKCLKICNCGTCRNSSQMNPYIPKNTLLGHDTRRIADDRSVESLVDFRLHNLGWLKKLGEEGRSQDSKRMQRLREQAQAEKAKVGELQGVVAGASAEADAVMRESISGGYDIQGDVSGHEVTPAQGRDNAGSAADAPGELVELTGHGEGAADTSLAEEGDRSAYPDPTSYLDASMLARERMLGLGYYQQDDSPDKILFDPYQQPSEDAIAADDEPSEFLKKSLRAAKRRARQEKDKDPDFYAPRSHQRKRPRLDKDGNGDVNNGDQDEMNLDPALLQTDLVAQDTVEGAGDLDGATGGVQPDAPVDAEGPIATTTGGALLFEANVPTLRHAKPIMSYLEAEDGLEEFDEIIPVRDRSQQESRDPLDLAAEAVRAATKWAGSSRTPGSAEIPVRRRRGRPRGSGAEARRSTRLSDAVSLSEPKKQGRESRTSKLASAGLDRAAVAARELDGAASEEQADGDDAITNELEAQLAAELAWEEQTTSAANAAKAAETTAQVNETPQPKRKRGRPPKKKTPAEASSTPASRPSRGSVRSFSTPVDTRFLSMAERMALKGKKFRIGQRRKVSQGADDATDKASTPADERSRRNEDEREGESQEQQESSQEADTNGVLGETVETGDAGAGELEVEEREAEEAEEAGADESLAAGASDAEVPDAEDQSSFGIAEGEDDESMPDLSTLIASRIGKHASPTVVRLGDSDEESDYSAGRNSDGEDDKDSGEDGEGGSNGKDASSEFGDDSDDDDDDIPAVRPSVARRGGHVGAMRGGGGRGRGRALRGRAIRGGR